MNRTKAYRREQEKLHKHQAYKKIKQNSTPIFETIIDEKTIGKATAVHNAFCSCPMCGNPRKFFQEVTQQEKKSLDNEKQQRNEYGM